MTKFLDLTINTLFSIYAVAILFMGLIIEPGQLNNAVILVSFMVMGSVMVAEKNRL